MGRTGERDGYGPVKAGAGGSLQGGRFSACGEGRQPSAGRNQKSRGAESGFHAVDGAECHAIERCGESFRAAGMHAGGDTGDTDCLLEERGFLALGLGEGDGDRRPTDGDGNAGKAGAGAVVEEGLDPGGQRLRACDGFNEMTLQDAFSIADTGEVGAGVPALDQGEIVCKLFIFFVLQKN